MLSNVAKILILTIALVFYSGLAAAGDEDKINKDLADHKGGNYTLPAGTYTITNTVSVPEGTILKGEMSENGELLTKIILADNADFECWQPLIDLSDNSGIGDISINANSETQGKVPTWRGHTGTGTPKKWGQGYHNIIRAQYCENIKLWNLELFNGLGDGIRVINSNNIEIDNIRAWKLGHDAIFIIRSEAFWISNCYIQPRVSCGIRVMSSKHGRIWDNYIKYVPVYDGVRYDAGSNILIQQDSGVTEDIEVLGNVFLNSCGPGAWLADKIGGENKISFKWNLFSGCGSNSGIYWAAGIISNGYDATFQHNVFDGCYLGSFVSYAVNAGWEIEANTAFDSNIFTNTIPGAQTGEGGYGIYNTLGQNILSSNNCFWNNKAGNVYGCTLSDSDIFENPKKQETPSGWEWVNNEWTCAKVTPSAMEKVTGDNSYGPITDEEILQMDDIFDILSLEFSDTGRTEQTADNINFHIVETEKGRITGGIKIVGFKDLIKIDNVSYIPDNESVLVKYVAFQTPFDEWFNGGFSNLTKDVDIKIENGEAKATLTVKLRWFTVKTDSTGKKIKKYHTSKTTFNDSCRAPDILRRESTAKALVNVFEDTKNPISRVRVDHTNTTQKIVFSYGENTTTHRFMIGERHTNETGLQSTIYSRCDIWEGSIPHMGNELIIIGEFDPDKLHIKYYTPFDSFEVTDIEIVYHETKEENYNMVILKWIVQMILVIYAGYKIMDITIN